MEQLIVIGFHSGYIGFIRGTEFSQIHISDSFKKQTAKDPSFRDKDNNKCKITAVDISEDGQKAVIATESGHILIWNVRKGARIVALKEN